MSKLNGTIDREYVNSYYVTTFNLSRDVDDQIIDLPPSSGLSLSMRRAIVLSLSND